MTGAPTAASTSRRHGRRPGREQVALRRHARAVAFYSAGHGSARRLRRGAPHVPARGPAARRGTGARDRPELLAWSAGLGAYAIAAAAIAWGEAAGWDERAFRVYYAAGALLTAPLLGAGSLLLAGRRRAAPVALVYAGLAVGIALAMPVHGTFAAHGIPAAQDHLAFLPARLLAIVANIARHARGRRRRAALLPAPPARERPDHRRHRRGGSGQRARRASAPRAARSGSRSARCCFTQDSSLPAHIPAVFRPKMAHR